mmetsp:Transcript_93247/g.279730  ORF Transcript_93247/g.279730 Transcript_93247/m.279730 type:complete len:261 (+) Transcript_93247:200-982(+)
MRHQVCRLHPLPLRLIQRSGRHVRLVARVLCARGAPQAPGQLGHVAGAPSQWHRRAPALMGGGRQTRAVRSDAAPTLRHPRRPARLQECRLDDAQHSLGERPVRRVDVLGVWAQSHGTCGVAASARAPELVSDRLPGFACRKPDGGPAGAAHRRRTALRQRPARPRGLADAALWSSVATAAHGATVRLQSRSRHAPPRAVRLLRELLAVGARGRATGGERELARCQHARVGVGSSQPAECATVGASKPRSRRVSCRSPRS